VALQQEVERELNANALPSGRRREHDPRGWDWGGGASKSSSAAAKPEIWDSVSSVAGRDGGGGVMGSPTLTSLALSSSGTESSSSVTASSAGATRGSESCDRVTAPGVNSLASTLSGLGDASRVAGVVSLLAAGGCLAGSRAAII